MVCNHCRFSLGARANFPRFRPEIDCIEIVDSRRGWLPELSSKWDCHAVKLTHRLFHFQKNRTRIRANIGKVRYNFTRANFKIYLFSFSFFFLLLSANFRSKQWKQLREDWGFKIREKLEKRRKENFYGHRPRKYEQTSVRPVTVASMRRFISLESIQLILLYKSYDS